MSSEDERATAPLWQRLLWFALLWGLGVAVVGTVAYVIRLWLL